MDGFSKLYCNVVILAIRNATNARDEGYTDCTKVNT